VKREGTGPLLGPLASHKPTGNISCMTLRQRLSRPEEISMIGAEIEGPPTGGVLWLYVEDRATSRYRCMARN
jgi:hypothetical protein